jgi:hypothetical protein
MLSYLDAVKKTCPLEIYNRGLKAYLEGKVLTQTEMVLDFWRSYKVEDRDIYTVQMPLLHLALSPEKENQADKAILQSASCDCAYFNEFGICKHIVAVCASLENEFNINLKKQKRQKTYSSSVVFDSILEVDTEKKIRKFLISFEDFLEIGYKDTSFLENFILEIKNDAKYPEVLNKLKNFILEKIEYYEYEKKLLRLVKPTLILDSKNWWPIWHKVQTKFSSNNQIKFFDQVWKSYLAGNLNNIKKELETTLKNLKEKEKLQVFEFLQKEYQDTPENWLDFVLLAGMENWVEENLNLLDPIFLLKIIQTFPDIREKTEIHLLEQVKLWSDFLETGQNYAEISEVFSIWQNKLGGSSYCQEAIDYIKQNHPKKKKLLKQILQAK